MRKNRMDNKPVRVLHYIKHLESGGGETLLYNIYQNIDRSQVQFDFLVNDSKEEKLDRKISRLGGRKIVLIKKEPVFTPLKILLVIIELKKMLVKGRYNIFHIHCSNGQGLLYAYIAKLANIPVRIVHIHNTAVDGKFVIFKRLFHELCKKLFISSPTDYFACSELAANWLYTQNIVGNKQYTIIKNGIDINKFIFNSTVREETRTKLGINGKKVLINIGRMEPQKNQVFLLNILSRLVAIDNAYVLILIGTGSLKTKIKELARKMALDSNIYFIEYTSQVQKYLWASDLFVLPSLHEGLGIVAVEAQAAGLKTIVSDAVPKEAYVSKNISPLSLDTGYQGWADKILSINLDYKRIPRIQSIKQAGYDIKDTAMLLQEFYLTSLSKNFKIHSS